MKDTLIPFSVRFDENVHRKLKVIAAYHEKSLNTFMNDSLAEVVQNWEREHGEIKFPKQ